MVYSIKEFLQIDVDHPVVALDDEGLGLGDGLMRRAVRAESEARLGERRVPLRVQDLEDRLLDQAIQHGGDAQEADPTVGLRYLHPTHRLRSVGPLQQLGPDRRPERLESLAGLFDGQAIDSGGASVGTDSVPGSDQVLAFTDLLRQRDVGDGVLGCSVRRGWFGPFPVGPWGFTGVFREEGQLELDFRPRSTHESRLLLTLTDRSGLGPSLPARLICCPAFRRWGA